MDRSEDNSVNKEFYMSQKDTSGGTEVRRWNAESALLNQGNFEFAVIMLGGVLLSFNSGLLNGLCLLSNKVTVTHISGDVSNAALGLGNEDFSSVALYLDISFFFILGSSSTGFMIAKHSFQKEFQHGPSFLLGTILLLAAWCVALIFKGSRCFYYICAIASGVQNAMGTRFSGSIIRTTHVTGTATDIGIILGHILKGQVQERWKLSVLLPLFAGFFAGSYTSVFTHRYLGFHSVLINVFLFAAVGIAYVRGVSLQLSIPFWRVLTDNLEEPVVTSANVISYSSLVEANKELFDTYQIEAMSNGS